MVYFDQDGIPENRPLSNEQKSLDLKANPSGVIPSGEANFYDFYQSHIYHKGSGINVYYPHPTGKTPLEFDPISGIIRTYPSDNGKYSYAESGILNYSNLSSIFSNAIAISGNNIQSFNISNPYIHYYPKNTGAKPDNNNNVVEIPFVSSYKETNTLFSFYPYKNIIKWLF